MTDKAKKITPPTDMEAHNAELQAKADAVLEEAAKEQETTLTTKQVAQVLGTDPRTLRKFLRSSMSGIEAVGQGKRYALRKQSLPSLAKKFDRWAGKAEETEEVSEAPEVDEVEIIDDLGEAGPNGCHARTSKGELCKGQAGDQAFCPVHRN